MAVKVVKWKETTFDIILTKNTAQTNDLAKESGVTLENRQSKRVWIICDLGEIICPKSESVKQSRNTR